MNADSGVSLRALKVDGGATANNFLMQLQADSLGTEVIRPTDGPAGDDPTQQHR